MNLFQLGDFKLSSGAQSGWKIDCDALTSEDLAALALMGSKLLPPFGWPVGIPRGGLLLAEEMSRYCTIGETPLIVDDVLTSGGSMEREKTRVWATTAVQPLGLVIFARGPCPAWVKAIFQLPEPLWVKP